MPHTTPNTSSSAGHVSNAAAPCTACGGFYLGGTAISRHCVSCYPARQALARELGCDWLDEPEPESVIGVGVQGAPCEFGHQRYEVPSLAGEGRRWACRNCSIYWTEEAPGLGAAS